MPKADIVPIIEFLSRHAPFDRMGPEEQECLAQNAKLAFFAKDEVVQAPEEGEAKRFFILKQGRIRRETRGGNALPEGAWEMVAGESFPIGALLSRRPVFTVQRAVEDTFAYVVPRECFDDLYRRSPVFHDFCSRRLANLLDQALRATQGSKVNQAAGEPSLGAPLHSLIRREPISSSTDTPLGSALQRMQDERVGSVVIVDEAHRPIGIFTLHDLLSRVALPELPLDTPMLAVMTPNPYALSRGALARDAAMVMAERGFAHICVTGDDGRLLGVLSERDLFSLQRVGLVNISRAIPRAASVEALAGLGRDVHQFVDQMLAQGASVAQLTQITALLNDHITRRAIELALAEHGQPALPFTWLAFGSEGRGEQTLRTDQDNGILFKIPDGSSADAARAELLPLARRINEALDACGFPLCTGNVMASNPECCLSLEEWRERFGHWIDQGTPEHLLNASIYFDMRPLWGDGAPVKELLGWLAERTKATPRFLHMMAANSLRNRPPLGVMRDFVVQDGDGDHPDTLDLKLSGVTPFVDGARILSLAHGIARTNTLERFRALVERGAAAAEEVEAWCDAYGFIQLVRMRLHQSQEREGQPLENHLNPDTLSDLDRRLLKESFRQARKLQSRLALDYRL